MIEEAFLPVWFMESARQQFFAKNRAQSLNPFFKRDALYWQRYEKMNVVRHNYITADRDVMVSSALAERAKRFVETGVCKESESSASIKSHEIDRPQT
jgi:hypothetical protein